jgi:hypothetical protein
MDNIQKFNVKSLASAYAPDSDTMFESHRSAEIDNDALNRTPLREGRLGMKSVHGATASYAECPCVTRNPGAAACLQPSQSSVPCMPIGHER